MNDIILLVTLAQIPTNGHRRRFWVGPVCGNIRFRISQKNVGEQIQNNVLFLFEKKKMLTEQSQEISKE
jgi:hypothetical protein